MIDLSHEQKATAFLRLFVHGALFHVQNFAFPNSDQIKNKFMLVVRGCQTDGNCYFYLTTSQVEKRKSNPLMRDRLYVFEEGTVECFSKETAIDIEAYFQDNYDKYKHRYLSQRAGRRLDYICMIDDYHMKVICERISASDQISPFVKRQLVPR